MRQAESTDARLEIRREEKENSGKKEDEQAEDETTSQLWEDSTTVSVMALRTFLVEFLKSRGDETQSTPANNAQDFVYTDITPEVREPVTPIAARAVKAYTSMANHAAPPPPPVESKNKEEEQVDLADLLKADELRTIHVLISELDQLDRRGVQTLVIEKADTFLEALVAAVRLQKSSV